MTDRRSGHAYVSPIDGSRNNWYETVELVRVRWEDERGSSEEDESYGNGSGSSQVTTSYPDGWYPDPNAQQGERWYANGQWTSYTRWFVGETRSPRQCWCFSFFWCFSCCFLLLVLPLLLLLVLPSLLLVFPPLVFAASAVLAPLLLLLLFLGLPFVLLFQASLIWQSWRFMKSWSCTALWDLVEIVNTVIFLVRINLVWHSYGELCEALMKDFEI